jgi:hypothetical protein
MQIILGKELIPLREREDLSCGRTLTGVLVGEMKDRAEPGLVILNIFVKSH